MGLGWLKAGLVVYILKKLQNGHFGPLVPLEHEDEALEREAVRSWVLLSILIATNRVSISENG